MDNNELVIKKRRLKGDDGYHTFSIRLLKDVVEQLDKIADDCQSSRNDVISQMLNFGIANYRIEE